MVAIDENPRDSHENINTGYVVFVIQYFLGIIEEPFMVRKKMRRGQSQYFQE